MRWRGLRLLSKRPHAGLAPIVPRRAGVSNNGLDLRHGDVSGPLENANFRTRRRLPIPRQPIPKDRLPLRLKGVSLSAADRRRRMRRAARFGSALRGPHAKARGPFVPLRLATRCFPAGKSQSAQFAWAAHDAARDRRTPDAVKAWPTSLRLRGKADPESRVHSDRHAAKAPPAPKPPLKFRSPEVA